MAKPKGKSLQQRYKYPLPIHPIDYLPSVILHNPVSWVYWAYCFWKATNIPSKRVHIEFEGGVNFPHIVVQDKDDMKYLWKNGFFGTGQLSRSEPTWLERQEGASKERSNDLALEKITERRRIQRLEFKKERVKLEKQLLDLRRNGGNIEQENALLVQEREMLRMFKQRQQEEGLGDNNSVVEESMIEGTAVDHEYVDIESLELMSVEATFLSFALPILDISPKVLLSRLFGPSNDITYGDIHKFITHYVTYHHYRSLGWCVRSGIKFGCDYLLYKRGPPFQHAEFCIMVLDHDKSKDYTWYSSISRVIGGAKKTCVLCYVERLLPEDQIVEYWRTDNFIKLFGSYRVGEVIYKRWIPGKNRD
ncbi:tRNA splicing endonuclease subunit SEN2 KNAG_0G02240 [Huiozyma naganishii CBS 8797]|uniref:tRNA-splicing endonuclease subunit Sen2 n=1 Tax=Huiozyma naganishii (strain ATCC MYA-139 / BCRC 22969 / CBS 8797 / KCTC 17520 / NBRC 10181 / NCYC 3082 / Yp74L-3) TaxID=1071383 RepID=J7S135_HUIN7|nr:hypothetical protein KNAG_0G02240 [Kazachstania naganishii CBS 8797]CCK71282.1 hypothetical protein KNAG_0G02240 [Kazachstania naganishii CBS 8797]